MGGRQGCGLSPYLFNLILEAVMSLALKDTEIVNRQMINFLRFADDIDLIAEERPQLQELKDRVQNSSKSFGLKINREKTKTMTIGKNPEKMEVKPEGETREQVTGFVYLGGLITEDAKCTKDISDVWRTEENVEIK